MSFHAVAVCRFEVVGKETGVIGCVQNINQKDNYIAVRKVECFGLSFLVKEETA